MFDLFQKSTIQLEFGHFQPLKNVKIGVLCYFSVTSRKWCRQTIQSGFISIFQPNVDQNDLKWTKRTEFSETDWTSHLFQMFHCRTWGRKTFGNLTLTKISSKNQSRADSCFSERACTVMWEKFSKWLRSGIPTKRLLNLKRFSTNESKKDQIRARSYFSKTARRYCEKKYSKWFRFDNFWNFIFRIFFFEVVFYWGEFFSKLFRNFFFDFFSDFFFRNFCPIFLRTIF